LPLAALDLARGTKHLELVRYTLLASPAVYALIAGALPPLSGKLRHLPPLLTALACAMALPAAYSTWWKADWRALAAVLDRQARPGDVIVFAAYDSWPSANAAYLHTSYYRRTAANPIVLLRDPADEELKRQLRNSPGVLLVTPTRESVASVHLDDRRLHPVGFEPGAGAVFRVEATPAS